VISAHATAAAAKVPASRMAAPPSPSAAVTRPPAAGPASRPIQLLRLFSEFAVASWPAGSSRGTSAFPAGPKNCDSADSAKATATTIGTRPAELTASKGSSASACMTLITTTTRRRSHRSTYAPATLPNSRLAEKPASTTPETAAAEPVSRST
jgi:hypothetical protein